jgi:PEP-CTERM motif
MKHLPIVAGLVLSAGCFTAGAQSVVVSTGPIFGNALNFSINQGFALADPFFLGQPATIGSASFTASLNSGDALASVDWAIASTPFGSPLASGTALNPAGVFLMTSNTGGAVDSETFSIPNVSLGSGFYYFELQNAQTVESAPAYWDANLSTNGAAVQYQNGSFHGNTPEESFTLFAPAPEPATLALACLGPVLMLALRRKK